MDNLADFLSPSEVDITHLFDATADNLRKLLMLVRFRAPVRSHTHVPIKGRRIAPWCDTARLAFPCRCSFEPATVLCRLYWQNGRLRSEWNSSRRSMYGDFGGGVVTFGTIFG